MEITTYEFYKNEYRGSLDESSFENKHSKACDKLKYLTFGRVCEDTLPELKTDDLEKAVCVLIDMMHQIDEQTKACSSVNGGNVKSLSSGGQSVTFGDNVSIYTKVLSSIDAQNALYRDAVAEYIGDTGLLYGGV